MRSDGAQLDVCTSGASPVSGYCAECFLGALLNFEWVKRSAPKRLAAARAAVFLIF